MYRGIVLVTTFVDSAGQFVTVAAHEVTVKVCVVYTTEVVIATAVELGVGVVVAGVTGQTVCLSQYGMNDTREGYTYSIKSNGASDNQCGLCRAVCHCRRACSYREGLRSVDYRRSHRNRGYHDVSVLNKPRLWMKYQWLNQSLNQLLIRLLNQSLNQSLIW